MRNSFFAAAARSVAILKLAAGNILQASSNVIGSSSFIFRLA